MAKKQRLTDTISGAVKAFTEAAKPLPECPPEMTLREKDKPFWLRIAHARAREEWDGPQIIVGIQLARCQADIETEQALLDGEGSVVVNERGTPISNPRFTVLERLTARQQNLMRSMALNATAATRAVDLKKQRGPEIEARKARAQVEDESLLA